MDKERVLEKEIDLIQGCINRMASNSFIIKGWLISLVAIVLALLPEKFDIRLLCVICLVITFCFWYVDGFFLKTERLYRWKYEWVIKKRLTTEKYCYDLDPYNEAMWLINKDGKNKKNPWVITAMFSKTLIPIYIPIIVLITFMFLNSYINWF